MIGINLYSRDLSKKERKSFLAVVMLTLALTLFSSLGCTVMVHAEGGESIANQSGQQPAVQAAPEYVIGAADLLAINVWKEPEISRAVAVRSDGRISLPLIGEIQAASRTPEQLQEQISHKLKDFISEPGVTVIVQEIRSQRFSILGEVGRPGTYLLSGSTTVLEAIATAGGFRDFAKQKSIYILRRDLEGKQVRLPFNYRDVIKGKNMKQNIALQPHDTVVVP